jgi:23S rRNA U2552 (ribose-2'-O)-methylase RlmE/FtsJ
MSLTPTASRYLRGADEQSLLKEVGTLFRSVKVVKPAASRKDSSEVYLLATGKLRIAPKQGEAGNGA